MSGAILVFAKSPEPGRVKTRMTPPLSAALAAELYARMLDDILEHTGRLAAELGLQPFLVVDPPSARAAMAARAPETFRVMAQEGSDLAARMERAVGQVAAAGHTPILVRSSDSPSLGLRHLQSALRALAIHDLVLCPDRRGGYVLVGLRRPAAGLFDHPMSTGNVLADTLANGKALGLSTETLTPCFDLNCVSDFRWLMEARAKGESLACPRTLAFLDERQLW
ncbi:MAG: TIGR04282 family arsenosugar biosynthesis glycosyltransferase [Gemmatimonadota bacterium]|nr:MAG: TIGR04282 family arsenosugar biosynthesis glycosyltransferase [Gemmatimonadota bacterium]